MNWECSSDASRRLSREALIGANLDLVLLTAPEVDRFLRMTPGALYEMIQDGKIRGGFRLGRYWRFRKPVVEQYVREQEEQERR